MREEQIIAGKEYRLLADQYFLLATETVAGEQVGISMNAFNAECDRAGRQAGSSRRRRESRQQDEWKTENHDPEAQLHMLRKQPCDRASGCCTHI